MVPGPISDLGGLGVSLVKGLKGFMEHILI